MCQREHVERVDDGGVRNQHDDGRVSAIAVEAFAPEGLLGWSGGRRDGSGSWLPSGGLRPRGA